MEEKIRREAAAAEAERLRVAEEKAAADKAAKARAEAEEKARAAGSIGDSIAFYEDALAKHNDPNGAPADKLTKAKVYEFE